MGKEILQKAPRRKISPSEVGEIFTGLTAGLQDGKKIIAQHEKMRVPFGSLAPTDVRTIAFSESNLTADARHESELNCEGLEGTGGPEKPV